jgi:hypothetical protein
MSVTEMFTRTTLLGRAVVPALGMAALLACIVSLPAVAQREASTGLDDGFTMQEDSPKDDGPADDMSGPVRVPKFPGIVVLFSGKEKEVAQNWIYQGSKKPAGWKVENGAMVTSAESLLSKQNFLDFQLHVEFKVPYMPEAHGQERGNSGVGLLATYEIQVLDSYGWKEPGSGDCGAVYSQAAPLVNACKPPRQWQTYDITFHAARWENGVKVKNARVTVFLNGICVQNNQDIRGATGIASHETEGPGPIYLQYHNNTVRFRNVWVLPLAPEGATHYEPRQYASPGSAAKR